MSSPLLVVATMRVTHHGLGVIVLGVVADGVLDSGVASPNDIKGRDAPMNEQHV